MKLHQLSNVRFLTIFVAIAAPFAAAFQDNGGAAPTKLDAAAIDAMFDQAWTAAGLKAASPADDAEWLRRASLVLNGVTPTADEVSAFISDHSQGKRGKKVDEMIARAEFGEHWGDEWTRMLVGRGARMQRFDRNGFTEWVEEQFNKNVPFNEFTKNVLTASGRADDNPAVGYIEKWQAEPKDLAGQTAKVFLGVQIQCARCHDHKDQQWKQSEFNDFAAYFAMTNLRRAGDADGKPIFEVRDQPEPKRGKAVGKIAKKALEERAKKAKNPEAAQKMMEKAELTSATPTPLRPLAEGPLAMPNITEERNHSQDDTKADDTKDTQVEMSRREQLAAWITKQGNPYYARSVVNSTFARMFGYGLINPTDDFRSDSTVAVPALLDALAKDFEQNGYDYKRLVATLAKTKAFSLASAGDAKEKEEARESHEKMFARYVMRPMSPEQMFDSITRATGIDEVAEERAKKLKNPGKAKKGQMTGEKIAEMYGKVRQGAIRKFVTTFEDDESSEDISFEGTIPQALLMMNSRMITDSMSRGMTVQRVMERGNDKIDWVYLSILSRKPTSDERAKSSAFLQKNGGEKKETIEDLAWALLNSAEFSTIH